MAFASAKLILHLFSNTNYGFHRDEFLYLDEGNHLAWGFFEVPPMLPFLGKVWTTILGDSLFAVRLLPALIGVLLVILIGKMVRDLGGKQWAVIIACGVFILSPSFLRTHTLFQPVSLNQFWWFLSAFWMVRLIKREQSKYWYYLGITTGFAMLSKYSIAFFLLAMFIGLLLTKERKWLTTKHPWIALGIGILICLPNLFWQYNHNFPVVTHMADLAATQLVNVAPFGFLKSQLLMQATGFLIWLPGLFWLFGSGRKFKVLGWIYVFTILILLLLSGKGYYSLGAYPMLFAAGGVFLENFFEKRKASLKYAYLSIIVLPLLVLLPFGLPILPIQKMMDYTIFFNETGIMEQRWEDGKIYPLPQDYADMHGWEEMAAKVAKVYHNFEQPLQKNIMIYGGSYSHAGTINYYRKKYNLPEAYSLNSSYQLWAPDSLHFDRQIMIDDVKHESSSWFGHMVFVDSIENPLAREKGYIYFKAEPIGNVDSVWTNLVRANRAQLTRK